MAEVEEKTEKSAKSKKQETGNRDSTAGPLIGRAANALKAQRMYRTNGQANPGKDHTTSQYTRHFHAKRGLRRLLLEQALFVLVVSIKKKGWTAKVQENSSCFP